MRIFENGITLSGNPSDASAVKLIRSIHMKGVVVLYLGLLEAIHAFQVGKVVLNSLGETMDGNSLE